MSTSASLHLATEADAHRRQPATAAVRAGIDSDAAHGAVVPPICLSTNFSFAGFDQKRNTTTPAAAIRPATNSATRWPSSKAGREAW
jgi:cystathionine beta-lyase/cystathionine gamma-synthase